MAHIYTDDETSRFIEDLKSKDDSFNLSKFVKRALMDYNGSDGDLDINKINHELTQAKHDLNKTRDKVLFLTERKTKFLANNKLELENKEKEIAENTTRILKYCNTTEKKAFKLATEYHNHPNKSITNFLDEKGVELKHTQQLKGGNNT